MDVMNVYIANESEQKVGGGWSFIENFTKYAMRAGVNVQMVSGADKDTLPGKGDILLIAGATMTRRDLVTKAKENGARVVLRVDNAPKNSRNRNTGTPRLKDFADMADLIVYQSEWARAYLWPFLVEPTKHKRECVILNGSDHEVFRKDGLAQFREGQPQCMYVQYNRDDTKRWHEAWYEFQILSRQNPGSHLWIVGNFSPELQKHNFDFFMGEQFRYVGVVGREDMAEYMRACDTLFLPYYNDACSNTLIEAKLCGVPDIRHNATGGSPEIAAAPDVRLRADTMVSEYVSEFHHLL